MPQKIFSWEQNANFILYHRKISEYHRAIQNPEPISWQVEDSYLHIIYQSIVKTWDGAWKPEYVYAQFRRGDKIEGWNHFEKIETVSKL